MAEKMNGLSLDFIIHPGETLKEVLEEKQMIFDTFADKSVAAQKIIEIDEQLAGN